MMFFLEDPRRRSDDKCFSADDSQPIKIQQ